MTHAALDDVPKGASERISPLASYINDHEVRLLQEASKRALVPEHEMVGQIELSGDVASSPELGYVAGFQEQLAAIVETFAYGRQKAMKVGKVGEYVDQRYVLKGVLNFSQVAL